MFAVADIACGVLYGSLFCYINLTQVLIGHMCFYRCSAMEKAQYPFQLHFRIENVNAKKLRINHKSVSGML